MHRLIYLAVLCTLAAASCENATAPTDSSTAPQSSPAETGPSTARSLHSTPLSLEVSRDGDKDKVRVVGLARDGYVSGVSFLSASVSLDASVPFCRPFVVAC